MFHVFYIHILYFKFNKFIVFPKCCEKGSRGKFFIRLKSVAKRGKCCEKGVLRKGVPPVYIWTKIEKRFEKSMFSFEFRVGVWRNRFVKAMEMQHCWEHNLKKITETFSLKYDKYN